jgi:hypothetical protein
MNATHDSHQDPVDIITFPGTDPTDKPTVHRRLRRLVEPGLMTIGIVLAVAGAQNATGPDTAGTRTAPAAVTTLVGHPRLIAPTTASAGERIIVLAYAHRGRCGPTELRFDGDPVTHRLNRYIGSPDPDWIEMFMTLDVPTVATRGRHEVQLYGPGRNGGRCDYASTQLELLATVTITLGP